ncbi:DNA polymerase III subunit gamma/tau [Spirochaeta thermophila]|uniref:DNA polymerase III subunit gamma/tau n=1 Tax=Winmispira thermophila (strain ATCC 49972 / DSM 6192 / RI 19.B1) TaxID=665571 RepID=E0RRQ8_WINT6|nr:DNA polymerase III subunit gamma/tau [Spirochaeta thermophila]ADN03162.1 hypothetical protein STHERM_c22350 [Spirochaeta thermophila DSM 6192]
MSFEVTANRRRPQTFKDLKGQEFVVSTLTNALKAGRVAHAYLFSGPRGVGKTSAARILAKALNCEQGVTPEPCGTCTSCKEISQGTAIDVIEIDGASNTSVNDVRVIREEVLFAPGKARYKVYIIDEVHMLSNSAFNALLKTIEEPPPYVVFIFATTELQRVPATIRSRCQQYHFRLISPEVIASLLREAASEMQVEVEEEALSWIAKEADGSLRDAYTLFDQVVSFSEGRLSYALIQEKLGLVGFERLQAVVEACAREEVKGALDLVHEILMSGVSVEQCVVDLAEYFRALTLVEAGIERESILGVAPSRFSKSVRTAFSPAQLERAMELILETYRNIRYSLNQRYDLELLVSRLAHLRRWVSSEDLVSRLERLRAGLVGGAVQASPPPEGAPDSREEGAGPRSPGEIREAVLARARAHSPTLQAALSQGQWRIQGRRVEILFSSKAPLALCEEQVDVIKRLFEEVAGRGVECVLGRMRGQEDRSPGEDVQIEEPVEQVRRIFKGEIVK